MDTAKELRLYNGVYGTLLVLTAASVGAYALLGLPRAAAVTVALAIAWAKAGLIGYHFMHLKHERPLVWLIVFIAVAAVLILAIGVIPDLAGRQP